MHGQTEANLIFFEPNYSSVLEIFNNYVLTTWIHLKITHGGILFNAKYTYLTVKLIGQDETQHQIPLNGESCADHVGLDYNQIENCANSSLGVQLMTDSLNFSNKSDVA